MSFTTPLSFATTTDIPYFTGAFMSLSKGKIAAGSRPPYPRCFHKSFTCFTDCKSRSVLSELSMTIRFYNSLSSLYDHISHCRAVLALDPRIHDVAASNATTPTTLIQAFSDFWHSGAMPIARRLMFIVLFLNLTLTLYIC